MTPSCHPSHVASQAKAEKTPCHKHTQALSHTHRHVHPHTCAHRHLCAYVFACAHVGTDVRRRTGARPRTSTHALRQRPGTQGQEPQQADLGPCPCSRPHWPSLCQSRPGGQDPWRVGGSVGERGGTRPGWRLCLWDTAPPTSEIDPWVGTSRPSIMHSTAHPLFVARDSRLNPDSLHSPEHFTEASSLWPQSLWPQDRAGQSHREDSFPLHFTSLSHMGPVPWPNAASFPASKAKPQPSC